MLELAFESSVSTKTQKKMGRKDLPEIP